ncbi:PE family protein [Mycobacterium decipiens]|uniref:PE family protein n=1 Tax=Mycobacterium decipiens TaxID=1430326 RepID=UPI00241890F6|nr:PE family protein [Mycobacterium decipiens]
MSGESGASLAAGNAAAASSTTAVVSAAADEVSTAIATLFSHHARGYQTVADQAAAFHSQFVRALTAGAGSYALAETAGASPLQSVIGALPASAQTLLSRPLIGNGANATTPGGHGADGGWLFGSGGNGAAGAAARPAATAGRPGCGATAAPAAPAEIDRRLPWRARSTSSGVVPGMTTPTVTAPPLRSGVVRVR